MFLDWFIILHSGAGTNLKVGGAPVRGEAPKFFFGRGSKSTISRVGDSIRDGQYSLVSFLFAVLLYHGAPRASHLYKWKRAHGPRAPWSRRHSVSHLYMRCSNVIVRRHVGGILRAIKTRAEMQKSENSYANVIHRPCFSTGVSYIIPHKHLASTRKFTTLH